MSNEFYAPKRVMAIFAHPDDIEFGCAGTVARWVQAGAEACYVLLTSGDVGIADLSLSRAEAAAIREKEQSAAAEAIGVQEVVYLREPDGTLVNTLELRKKLVREIRRFRPEVLICGDPAAWFIGDTYINHPDHRAAASAALEAVFPAAGQPHLFQELAEEGLRAHKVRKVYINEFGGGDTFVNISDVMDLKVAALHKHESQFVNFDPEPMIREWSANAGKGKEMAYAESFRVITLESDEEWAKRTGEVA
jgi:LmbE family N-acetylglucosaminyl deacetylase